jgi:hypothetical protein
MVLLAPLVGVVVDRYDSRALLLSTSLAQAAIAPRSRSCTVTRRSSVSLRSSEQVRR